MSGSASSRALLRNLLTSSLVNLTAEVCSVSPTPAGLLLFLVYINEVPIGDDDILFVDDCAIFASAYSKKEFYSRLQARLDLLAG